MKTHLRVAATIWIRSGKNEEGGAGGPSRFGSVVSTNLEDQTAVWGFLNNLQPQLLGIKSSRSSEIVRRQGRPEHASLQHSPTSLGWLNNVLHILTEAGRLKESNALIPKVENLFDMWFPTRIVSGGF